ncbi:MAG: gluconate 2-dehydrogenase subunit 3 family protein [Steroidobacter sp.]
MDRREVLKRVAVLMGGALSAPAILGVLNGCTSRSDSNWTAVFLDKEQALIVETIADLIIPRTDTPGANDVGAPGFIDLMLKDVYPPKDQQRFLRGLAALNEASLQRHGEAFVDLPPDKQSALVGDIHVAAVRANRLLDPSAPIERPFILMMKELTLLGYFLSLPGATRTLQYDAVPGAFKACLPLSEAGNGKTWADVPGIF